MNARAGESHIKHLIFIFSLQPFIIRPSSINGRSSSMEGGKYELTSSGFVFPCKIPTTIALFVAYRTRCKELVKTGLLNSYEWELHPYLR